VDVVASELRQRVLDVSRVFGNAVDLAVDRITELGILRFQQQVDVLAQVAAAPLKALLAETFLDEPVELKHRQAQREVSIRWFYRADPKLENLLAAGEVRLRLKEEHAVREVFDVGVVAIVQSA